MLLAGRLAVALSLILPYAEPALAESLTLTTSYPAPSGVYQKLITTDATTLARDGGSVGIGLAAPASKLDVSGVIHASGNIWASGAFEADSPRFIMTANAFDGARLYWFRTNAPDTSTDPEPSKVFIGLRNTNDGLNHADSLWLMPGYPSSGGLFVMNQSGFCTGCVGIGTASPGTALDVVGDLRANASYGGSLYLNTIGTPYEWGIFAVPPPYNVMNFEELYSSNSIFRLSSYYWHGTVTLNYSDTQQDGGGLLFYAGNGTAPRAYYAYLQLYAGGSPYFRIVGNTSGSEGEWAKFNASGYIGGSSRELKQDIKPLSDQDYKDLERMLDQTSLYSFERKAVPSRKEVGFIAEEAPDLIRTDDQKGIYLLQAIGFLTAVVKEQSRRIAALEKQVKEGAAK